MVCRSTTLAGTGMPARTVVPAASWNGGCEVVTGRPPVAPAKLLEREVDGSVSPGGARLGGAKPVEIEPGAGVFDA